MRRLSFLPLILGAVLLAHTPATRADEAWTSPTIKGYGTIHAVPDATFRPDPAVTYKVVFSMTHGAKAPGDVNPALDHVARAVNLYASAGVPLSHLKFVAVAHGEATDLVMDNAHYRKKYGVDNPNLTLLKELHEAGVAVTVCGQAAAAHAITAADLAPDVTMALSAITTITVLQQQGYALMPM